MIQQFLTSLWRLCVSLRLYLSKTWTDELLISALLAFLLGMALVWSTAYEKRMFTKEDSKSRKRFERIYLPSECVLEPTTSQGKGKGPNYFSFFSQSNKAAEVILAPERLPATSTPLLCFVNSRSGANQGKLVLAILKNLLHPAQVVDLAKNDPVKVLQTFSVLPGLRILVAGGDGTVGWILNAVEKINNLAEHTPPVAVLPLGTGNDLARVLGWGVSVDVDELPTFLDNVQHSSTIYLDRWEMIAYSDKKVEQRRVSFSNYLGIGVDASIIMRFHDARESAPHRFVSQIINKVWYGVMGGLEIFWRKCKGISKHIQLSADGKPIKLPEEMEGIIFSNIPSYGGGMHFWHEEEDDSEEEEVEMEKLTSNEVDTPARRRSTRAANRTAGEANATTKPSVKGSNPITRTSSRAWAPESVQDGVLELGAVNGSFHLARIKFGLSRCIKLAQASRYEVKITKRSVPVQVDGEPIGSLTSTIVIQRGKQVLMLKRTERGFMTADLIEWGARNKIITSVQRSSLLAEFSRRLELEEQK